MKKFIIGLALVGLLGAGGLFTVAITAPSRNAVAQFVPGKPEAPVLNLNTPTLPGKAIGTTPVATIKLTRSNTIIFRTDVDALSVAKVQKELLQKNKQLGMGEPIYLVLDTPGGDIIAGNQLIDTAKSIGRPVHTITLFAASMGFNFVQRLGKRYILPSGTLMAHRARVSGVGGQIPGEFLTAAATLYRLVLNMERQNAERLGISLDYYTGLVKDEYWVEGEDAVRQGAADSLAYVTCDETLDGSSYETFLTFFGPITIEWANCPAITQPLGFSFEGSKEKRGEVEEKLKNSRTIHTLRKTTY